VLTEEFLKQAALASINNALSHHESATLLFQNGKAPAAADLAIIGLEEFAKAVLFTIAAAVPEQRPILEARLKDLYEHNVKHVLTGMVDGAQEVDSEGWAVARDEGYPRSGEDMLADLFETLARAGIDDLIMPRQQAKTYYDDIRKDMGLPWPAPLLPNDPSKLKQVALYVDIGPDGTLSTPDRVGRRAEACIRELEYFLRYFHQLPCVLEDDEQWARFTARLRRVSTL